MKKPEPEQMAALLQEQISLSLSGYTHSQKADIYSLLTDHCSAMYIDELSVQRAMDSEEWKETEE